MTTTTINEIARVLVDAFDVDLQLYIGKSLKALRNTSNGQKFADWAESNKLIFEVMLRGISVLVQKLPKDNKTILYETIVQQLERLPVEIRRAVIDDSPTFTNSPLNKNIFDEAFNKKYEQALEGLTDDELLQVAKLNQDNLIEWVNSPAKIRPFLLKKWDEKKSALKTLNDKGASFFDGFFKEENERWVGNITIDKSAKLIGQGVGNLFMDFFVGQGIYCRITTPQIELNTPDGKITIPTNTITRIRIPYSKSLKVTTEVTTLTNGVFKGELLTRNLKVDFDNNIQSNNNSIDAYKYSLIYGIDKSNDSNSKFA